jgi:hypothetical protein
LIALLIAFIVYQLHRVIVVDFLRRTGRSHSLLRIPRLAHLGEYQAKRYWTQKLLTDSGDP